MKPIDAERVAADPTRAKVLAVRGHHALYIGFPLTGAAVWSVAALTRYEALPIRLAAVAFSIGIVAAVSAEAIRHYRRVHLCVRCLLRSTMTAARYFWGTGREWEATVPEPPKRVLASR